MPSCLVYLGIPLWLEPSEGEAQDEVGERMKVGMVGSICSEVKGSRQRVSAGV